MINLNIKSELYPDAALIELDEGNISFETGLRFVYILYNSDNIRIHKGVFFLKDELFADFVSKANGHKLFFEELLNSLQAKII